MVTLVLLPGMDGTGILFEPLLTELPAAIRTIVVAYPTQRTLDYSALESLAAQALPREDSFFLLAESFSGPIALSLAAKQPPGLMGVILCSTFARNPRPFAGKTAPLLLPLLPLMALPPVLLKTLLLGRWSTSKLIDLLPLGINQVEPGVLKFRLRQVFAVDVTAALASLQIPVLALRGDADRLVPRSAWHGIGAANPRVTRIEMAGPHALLQTRPVQATEHIVHFIGLGQNLGGMGR